MPTPLQGFILEALTVRPMTVTDLSIQLNRTPRAIANSLSSLRGWGLVSDGRIIIPGTAERPVGHIVQRNNPVLWSLSVDQQNL